MSIGRVSIVGHFLVMSFPACSEIFGLIWGRGQLMTLWSVFAMYFMSCDHFSLPGNHSAPIAKGILANMQEFNVHT